jgi:hypothetical protein
MARYAMPHGVVAARSRHAGAVCALQLRFDQVDDNVNVDSIVQSDFLPGHEMRR